MAQYARYYKCSHVVAKDAIAHYHELSVCIFNVYFDN
jgi:hypothetical protein